LSGRGLCDELSTRPEESYRLCCVVVCDLETSRMGAPYIYDISHLRVNLVREDADTFTKLIAFKGFFIRVIQFSSGARGGATGSGKALQVGRSRFRFTMVSLELFIDIVFSGRSRAQGADSTFSRNDNQEYFLGGKGGRCLVLTTLAPSRADCHEVWEPQPPENPQGLSKPLTEIALLFFLAIFK